MKTIKKTALAVLGATALALSARADKEVTATPTGKSLVVSSYPVIHTGGYSIAGRSYPIYTLSIAYQKGTNTFVCSKTHIQREERTEESFFRGGEINKSQNLADIVKCNTVFSEADALLDSAIREKRPIKITLSDDFKTIKKLEIYTNGFTFGEEK